MKLIRKITFTASILGVFAFAGFLLSMIAGLGLGNLENPAPWAIGAFSLIWGLIGWAAVAVIMKDWNDHE